MSDGKFIAGAIMLAAIILTIEIDGHSRTGRYSYHGQSAVFDTATGKMWRCHSQLGQKPKDRVCDVVWGGPPRKE